MTLYYDGFAGAIATLDGTTVTVAACSSAYVPSASDVDLDAIAAGEIDTGDAAGYTRQTVGVTWDVATRRLTFDDPIEFDLDGASDVQHFVVADASGDLAFVLSYDTPIEGYDGFELAPPVAASEADTAGIEARLLALETAPGPASPVPDPSEAPDGQMIVTFDGEYVLDDAPSGGGVESVVAGTGITVDDTDPANPIISATGGGGGGGAVGIVDVDLSAETGGWVECDLSSLPTTVATVKVSPPTDMDSTIEFSWPDMLVRAPLVVIIGGSPVKVGVYSPPVPAVGRQKTLLVTPDNEFGGVNGAWLDPVPTGSGSNGDVLTLVDGAPAWVTP